MIASEKPNILLILTDQQRYDTIAAHLDRFGVATPALDSLVKRGVTFAQAFCNNPICAPSRVTLQTGLHPSRAGVPCNSSPPLDEGLPTVAKRLRAAGYQTVYHGKSHLKGDLRNYGFEIAEENSHDPSTLMEAGRFWRNRDWVVHDRPFFHVVSFLDPHDIYFLDPDAEDTPAPAPWGNLEPDEQDRPIMAGYLPKRNGWSEGRWAYYRRFYRERVERVDGFIRALLDELTCSGFASNTWVIFTSDHGDLAGEHGRPFKGLSLYEGSIRVPLVIAPPEVRRLGRKNVATTASGTAFVARISEALANHIDMVPTILDLAGLPGDPDLPGRSLLPAVRGETMPDPEGLYFESTHNGKPTPALRAIRTRQWKYLLASGGEEELYRIDEDPWETSNRAMDPQVAIIRSELRTRLLAHLEREGDGFPRPS